MARHRISPRQRHRISPCTSKFEMRSSSPQIYYLWQFQGTSLKSLRGVVWQSKKGPQNLPLTSSDPKTCPHGNSFAPLYSTLHYLTFDMQHYHVVKHYENTPIQIYRKFHLQKNENFQIKNFDIFHISAQNIDCGYVRTASRRQF